MTICLDDQMGKNANEEKVFLRVDSDVFIGEGSGKRVEGNIFIVCESAIHLD